MLCPFFSGKSAATWLDRLHSSKGFTLPSPDLSLDHFLLNPIPNTPTDDASDPPSDAVPSSASPSASPPLEEPAEGQEEELIDHMRAALADLFHMGSPARCDRFRGFRDRRGIRKQRRPKFCVVSIPASDGGSCPGGVPAVATLAATSPSIADNAGFRFRRKKAVDGKLKVAGKKKIKKRAAACLVLPDGENKGEVSSRTDVTVIDSSCSPNWKSAKIIFRKGTAWKVRDKKKWTLMRKERKFGLAQRHTGEKNNHEMQMQQAPPAPRANEKSFNLTRLTERSINDLKGGLPRETLDGKISFPEIRLQFSRSFRRARSKGHPVPHPHAVADEVSKRTLLPAPETE